MWDGLILTSSDLDPSCLQILARPLSYPATHRPTQMPRAPLKLTEVRLDDHNLGTSTMDYLVRESHLVSLCRTCFSDWRREKAYRGSQGPQIPAFHANHRLRALKRPPKSLVYQLSETQSRRKVWLKCTFRHFQIGWTKRTGETSKLFPKSIKADLTLLSLNVSSISSR